MKLNWVDDPQAESHLASLGLSWTRCDIHLKDLDVDGSKSNNARLDKPLCEETALEYACAISSGAKFPSIITYKNGASKHHILAGNHRTGAIVILRENGDIELDDCIFRNAYVVNSNDKMLLELVVRSSNRWQGRRQGKTEALEHVRWMMRQYNMELVELSKQFFLPIKWLKDKLRSDEIRQELEKQNTPTNHIRDTAILKLGQLSFNQKLMQRAAYVADQYKLNNESVKQMVDAAKVAGQNGEQSAIASIKEYEQTHKASTIKAPASASPIATRRPLRARFYQNLNAMHNFLRCGNKGSEFNKLSEFQITDIHDRHEAYSIYKMLKKKMDTIFHNAQNEKDK